MYPSPNTYVVLQRQMECGVTCVKILTLKLQLAAKFDLMKDKMFTQF